MTTQRNFWALLGTGFAPGALALIGHALSMTGEVLPALVWVAWVGCVAATVRIASGWRS